MRGKSFFLATAIALLANFYLASCAPSLEDPGVPNALLATPDTLSTVGLTDTVQVSLKMRCGCAYKLDSLIAVSGDIDKIVMLAVEKQSDEVSVHHVSFVGKTGTPSGSYSANYLFKAYSYSAQAFLPAPVTVKLRVP